MIRHSKQRLPFLHKSNIRANHIQRISRKEMLDRHFISGTPNGPQNSGEDKNFQTINLVPFVTLSPIRSLQLEGHPAQPNASLRQHHTNLEMEHPKKTWLVDSTSPHKQQVIFPFQPLFFSEVAKFIMLKLPHEDLDLQWEFRPPNIFRCWNAHTSMRNKSVKGFCCESFGAIKGPGNVIPDSLDKIHVLQNTKELLPA